MRGRVVVAEPGGFSERDDGAVREAASSEEALVVLARRQLVANQSEGVDATHAAVSPGNSGGPLPDGRAGDVLGLVAPGSEQANGIAFAVSGKVAELRASKRQRDAGRRPGRASL